MARHVPFSFGSSRNILLLPHATWNGCSGLALMFRIPQRQGRKRTVELSRFHKGIQWHFHLGGTLHLFKRTWQRTLKGNPWQVIDASFVACGLLWKTFGWQWCTAHLTSSQKESNLNITSQDIYSWKKPVQVLTIRLGHYCLRLAWWPKQVGIRFWFFEHVPK